jgi:hypothetical protein
VREDDHVGVISSIGRSTLRLGLKRGQSNKNPGIGLRQDGPCTASEQKLTSACSFLTLAMTRSTLSLICCGLSPGVSPGGHLTVAVLDGSVVRRRADPPIVPYTPILFLLPDVFRQHAFVFAVIPFADFWLGLKAAFWWGIVTE